MATIVAIAYPDQGTAEDARATIRKLEEDLIIQADQVAVVSRDPQGSYHVHTSHTGSRAPAEQSGAGSGGSCSGHCS